MLDSYPIVHLVSFVIIDVFFDQILKLIPSKAESLGDFCRTVFSPNDGRGGVSGIFERVCQERTD